MHLSRTRTHNAHSVSSAESKGLKMVPTLVIYFYLGVMAVPVVGIHTIPWLFNN